MPTLPVPHPLLYPAAPAPPTLDTLRAGARLGKAVEGGRWGAHTLLPNANEGGAGRLGAQGIHRAAIGREGGERWGGKARREAGGRTGAQWGLQRAGGTRPPVPLHPPEPRPDRSLNPGQGERRTRPPAARPRRVAAHDNPDWPRHGPAHPDATEPVPQGGAPPAASRSPVRRSSYCTSGSAWTRRLGRKPGPRRTGSGRSHRAPRLIPSPHPHPQAGFSGLDHPDPPGPVNPTRRPRLRKGRLSAWIRTRVHSAQSGALKWTPPQLPGTAARGPSSHAAESRRSGPGTGS